jgi:hypothetical protein
MLKSLGGLMNSDADRELAIFTEALKVPPQERDAFLERRCERDKALRQRLEALLRAHERLGNFLEEPPTGDPSIERN